MSGNCVIVLVFEVLLYVMYYPDSGLRRNLVGDILLLSPGGGVLTQLAVSVKEGAGTTIRLF